VTLDESWFYLNMDHEFIWLQPDEEVSEMERYAVQSEKVMLTIVWNSVGFYLVDSLSRQAKLKMDHYVTNILSQFAIWREIQVRKTDRKLIIHSDDVRPHTARRTLEFLEQNRMKRALHLSYSPNLALCDFYLFGYIKRFLVCREFADQSELLQAVMDILNDIEKATLEEVFLTWMRRLAKYINTNDKYVK
jgi:hypothetical protein